MNKSELNKILKEVPVDYYQKGIDRNPLQRYWHSQKLKIVLDGIKGSPKSILDVGCASGWFLNELSKHYPRSKCSGIDLYKEAITYGRKRYRHLHLTYGDAHSLPYPAKKFDLIICTEVLEHVIKPQKVLQEIRQVLKPTGTAIIEMDTANWMFTAVWFFWTHVRKGVWKDAHIYHFNERKLETMIKESGFKISQKNHFNFGMAVAFSVKTS